jgi:hypothetical protein
LLTKWLSASTIQTFFSFVWKIGLILIAGVTLLYQTLCNRAGESTPEDRARFTGRIIAAGQSASGLASSSSGAFCPISEANSCMLVPYKEEEAPHVTP